MDLTVSTFFVDVTPAGPQTQPGSAVTIQSDMEHENDQIKPYGTLLGDGRELFSGLSIRATLLAILQTVAQHRASRPMR